MLQDKAGTLKFLLLGSERGVASCSVFPRSLAECQRLKAQVRRDGHAAVFPALKHTVITQYAIESFLRGPWCPVLLRSDERDARVAASVLLNLFYTISA